MLGVTAHFLAVEDMERSQLADGLLGELGEGDVDEAFVGSLRDAAPGDAGGASERMAM